MVQDNQYLGHTVEACKQLSEPVILRTARVFGEIGHDGFCAGTGKVVNTKVKDCILKRSRPFDGNGHAAGFGNNPQQHGRFDVVMVSDGDHTFESQALLNLIFFELKSGKRGQWGQPVALPEINRDRRFVLSLLLLCCKYFAKWPVTGSVLSDEVKTFFGVVRVAMQ